MKLRHITDALTFYFNKKYPESKGLFIGKESFGPTRLNAFKEYKVDIFWRYDGKNHNVFTFNIIDKIPEEKKEAFKEICSTALLEQLFSNLNNIENEIIQAQRI